MELYFTAVTTIAVLFFFACASPGPDFINITSYSLLSRRAGLAAAMGAVIGVLILASVIAVGLATASAEFGTLYQVLKIGGAMYLAYLGCKAIKGALQGDEPPVQTASTLPSYVIFLRGVATNLANPKAAFFIASIFTTALPNGSDAEAYVASVLAVTIVACGVYATIAITFSLESVQATYRRSWRAVDAILGACFIGLAAKLAWQR